MTPQILLLLCLLSAVLVLFLWERVPSEVIALELLLALAFIGLAPADQPGGLPPPSASQMKSLKSPKVPSRQRLF